MEEREETRKRRKVKCTEYIFNKVIEENSPNLKMGLPNKVQGAN
jgi:predicted component of type VI protein secretion system